MARKFLQMSLARKPNIKRTVETSKQCKQTADSRQCAMCDCHNMFNTRIDNLIKIKYAHATHMEWIQVCKMRCSGWLAVFFSSFFSVLDLDLEKSVWLPLSVVRHRSALVAGANLNI